MPERSLHSCQPMTPPSPCAISSSRRWQSVLTWLSISSASSPANSTMFRPSISLSGTSVISSLTECQTISSRARFSTFESTVSTDSARASTINGALRSAESKELYLTFTRRRTFGSGVISRRASVIKASVPSDPVSTRVRSNWLRSSLKTWRRS